MKRLIAILLAAVMVFALAACGAEPAAAPAATQAPAAAPAATQAPAAAEPAKEAEPIKIGLLYPQSGASASAGQSATWVIRYVTDYINNELGGIQNLGGAKLKLVESDTQGDPEIAVSEFQRLVSTENIDVLLGGYNTAVANAVSQYCIASGVPAQFANAVGSDAYSVDNKYVFHANAVNANSTYYAKDRAAWQFEQLGTSFGEAVLAFVYDSADYGRESYESTLKNMEKNGYKEVIGIPIQAGDPSFASAIMQLKAREDEIDWVVPSMLMTDALVFLAEMKQYECNLPLFTNGGGFLQADFIQQAGANGDYVCSASMWFGSMYKQAWDQDWAKEVYDKFQADLGWEFDEAASCAWLGTWLIWDALERTAGRSHDEIAEAMAATSIERTDEHPATLMSGTKSVHYTSITSLDGGTTVYNCNKDAPIVFAMIQDGAYHVLFPENLAEPGYELPKHN